jgi:hypothetical protein
MEQIKCYCGHTTYCDCGPLEEQSAVEWFAKELYEKFEMKGDGKVFDELLKQAKEMEKEQKGYSEEEVRLAYFQGEKDSYIKGGQTKEMENEFIQSLQQSKSK